MWVLVHSRRRLITTVLAPRQADQPAVARADHAVGLERRAHVLHQPFAQLAELHALGGAAQDRGQLCGGGIHGRLRLGAVLRLGRAETGRQHAGLAGFRVDLGARPLPLDERGAPGWGAGDRVQGFPVAYPGMRIGLLGGSFDPAHSGHAHITREALKRLGLGRVWWLVSPGNPLKPRGPAPMAARLAAARAVMDHPRVVVSDLEARLGTRLTADTLGRLQAHYPGVVFVWLMGADNLAGLHRWGRWEEIAARVPLAVFARPGVGMRALSSPAARRMAPRRVRMPGALAAGGAPGWSFLQVPLRHISSSELRASGRWRPGE